MNKEKKRAYQRIYMREYRKKYRDKINKYQKEWRDRWKLIPVEVIIKYIFKKIKDDKKMPKM